MSLQYTGVLTPNFSLSAQYSARQFALTERRRKHTKDKIEGTLVLDLSRSLRYWSPTFCAGSTCDGDEQRNNSNVIVKGSYFLSNNASGSHHVVFGYDRFNDNIMANTHAIRQRLPHSRARTPIIRDGACILSSFPAQRPRRRHGVQSDSQLSEGIEPARCIRCSSTTTGG